MWYYYILLPPLLHDCLSLCKAGFILFIYYILQYLAMNCLGGFFLTALQVKQVYYIFIYGGSPSYCTPQDLHGGQENRAGAPGSSDPGAAEDRRCQRRGADQAPGCQRAGSDPAHDGQFTEASGGHLPEDGPADPGHRQLNQLPFQKMPTCLLTIFSVMDRVNGATCIWWLAWHCSQKYNRCVSVIVDIIICPKAQLKLETQLQCHFHFVCLYVYFWPLYHQSSELFGNSYRDQVGMSDGNRLILTFFKFHYQPTTDTNW